MPTSPQRGLFGAAFGIILVVGAGALVGLFLQLATTVGLTAMQMSELDQCELAIEMLQQEANSIKATLAPLNNTLPITGEILIDVANTVPDIEKCQNIVNDTLPLLEAQNEEVRDELLAFNATIVPTFNSTLSGKLAMAEALLNALNVVLTVEPSITVVQQGTAQLQAETNASQAIDVEYAIEHVVVSPGLPFEPAVPNGSPASADLYLVRINQTMDILTIPFLSVPTNNLKFTNFNPSLLAGSPPWTFPSTTQAPVYTIQNTALSTTCGCTLVGREMNSTMDSIVLIWQGDAFEEGDQVEIQRDLHIGIGYI